jgi:hypothetical protein
VNDYRVDWPIVMERASVLKNENQRYGLMMWVLQRWHVAEPPAAQAWADSHPDALSAKLMERSKKIPAEERKRVEVALGLVVTES